MKKNIPITVLMAVYNGEKFVNQAIESILNQTFKDFELLIINDGSTDKTEGIIRSYHDPRIRLVNNEKNLGLVKTLNKGLAMAKGKYIARLDADDIAMPDRLEIQYDFMENNHDIVLAGGYSEIIDENNNTISINKPVLKNHEIKYILFYTNPFFHSSIIFRKRIVIDNGGYDDCYGCEDYHLYMKLSQSYKLANIPKILIKYRQHENSICFNRGTQDQRLKIIEQIRLEYLKNYIDFTPEEFLSLNKGNFLLAKKLFKNFLSKEKFDKHEIKDIKKIFNRKYSLKTRPTIFMTKFINKIKKYFNSRKNIYKLKKFSGQKFEVDNWQISEFIINKIIPIVGIRPYPLNELVLIVSTVYYLKPDLIIEWGTHHGKSARIFYETVKYFKLNSKIHTIDLPEDVKHIEHPGKRRGGVIRGIKKIDSHLGDGLEISQKILNNFEDEKILFFLDGDHSYSSVKNELDTISKKYKDVSFLLHDTFFQTKESGYNVDPYEAVKNFINENPQFYIASEANTGLPGMLFLIKNTNH